jgi:hypothetical protein
MSFIFSRALVEEYSQASCSDTEQSAPSSGSLTPKPCLWHDKTMEVSRLSRFGMTCVLLEGSRGEELLTSFVAAFRAKTSAPQAKALASTASAAECGEKWHGSLAKYDPASSSWKTAQHSLLGDSEEFLETWPRWGLMRNGECWERPTLAHRTNGSGYGLWRTPSANVIEAKSTVVKLTWRKPSDPQVGLADQVMAAHRMQWPTPQARDFRSGDAVDSPRAIRKREAGWSPNLNDVVLWPTPTVCGNYNRKGVTEKSGDGLATAVATSLTMNYSDDTAAQIVKARTFPTATAYKGWSPNHNRAATDDRLDYTIEREAYTPGQDAPPMRLSPDWVELLMGWPKGWTNLQPLGAETGKATPRESPAELPTEATA